MVASYARYLTSNQSNVPDPTIHWMMDSGSRHIRGSFTFRIERNDNGSFVASIIHTDDKPEPDDVGALYYVIVVIFIYGCSILMMIASYIRKNKMDRKLNRYLKEMATVRKREQQVQLFSAAAKAAAQTRKSICQEGSQLSLAAQRWPSTDHVISESEACQGGTDITCSPRMTTSTETDRKLPAVLKRKTHLDPATIMPPYFRISSDTSDAESDNDVGSPPADLITNRFAARNNSLIGNSKSHHLSGNSQTPKTAEKEPEIDRKEDRTVTSCETEDKQKRVMPEIKVTVQDGANDNVV